MISRKLNKPAWCVAAPWERVWSRPRQPCEKPNGFDPGAVIRIQSGDVDCVQFQLLCDGYVLSKRKPPADVLTGGLTLGK